MDEGSDEWTWPAIRSDGEQGWIVDCEPDLEEWMHTMEGGGVEEQIGAATHIMEGGELRRRSVGELTLLKVPKLLQQSTPLD